MSRGKTVSPRDVAPDPIYNSELASKLINTMTRKGEKSKAEALFYGAMDIIQEKVGGHPIRVLEKAVENIKPVLEVKSRRVGGSTYQVPVEVRPRRRLSLALRWLIASSRARGGKSMGEKLAAELLDAYNSQGASVKKKEDTHRMAEANKSFSHYRW